MLNAQQAAMKKLTWSGVEPALDDLLSDPIVIAMMRRDGLDAHQFRDLLEGTRRPAPVFDPATLPATVPTSSF